MNHRHTTGKTIARALGLASLLLLLAGCATGGFPGAGYPGQSQYPGTQYPGDGYGQQAVVGTVEGLDLSRQRLILVTESQSQYGGGSRIDVGFDRNTRLFYQGREHAIEGLERGDVVRVETAQSGGRLWARQIEVLRDVRTTQGGQYGGQYGGDQYGGGQYGAQLRGNIGYIDTRSRVIEIDAGGYGSTYGGDAGANRRLVRYDDRTVVEYQGRRYRPQDLGRGDLVSIQARQVGNNEWLAERIMIERSTRMR